MQLTLYQLYQKMLNQMGPTGWWPADSKNEIICEAILIQNTNAKNAERATAQLRSVTNFDGHKIVNLPLTALHQLVFIKTKVVVFTSSFIGVNNLILSIKKWFANMVPIFVLPY